MGKGGERGRWGSALVVGGIDAPGVACSHAAAIAIKVEVAAVYARNDVTQRASIPVSCANGTTRVVKR